MRQTDASRADDGDGFAGDFIAQKWQIRMPVSPLVFASEMLGWPHFSRQRAQHEKSEFGRRLGEHVGGIGEGNFVAVGVGAIDVVKADRELRDYLQLALSLPRILRRQSGSRRVVIRPSMPDFTFSMITLLGGASG